MRNEKGLTLVELLAVIVILAIIKAIAIPAFGKIIDNSRIKSEKANAIRVIEAAELYFADAKAVAYLDSIGIPTLVEKGYLDNISTLGDTSAYVANAQPAWICSKPSETTKKGNKVTFLKATKAMITASDKNPKVGNEDCGTK